MTISIWRYSHLILAISSSIFILLATLTGIVLALEPISNQLKPYAVKNADTLSISKTIETLKVEYDEVISLEIDENDFILVSVFTKDGKNETFYINPFTARRIGDIIEKEPIFKFATNLHRSLFLKSTGRVIVSVVALLLFFMAVSGVVLIVKRQGGTSRFFSKIVKENFKQYYHIIIGRYVLIPMIIITITGIYLSLEKSLFFPSHKELVKVNNESIAETPKVAVTDFNIFKSTSLKDMRHLEFPFSVAAEDYFILKLKDRELLINQYNGKVVSEKEQGLIAVISRWSLLLHTGQGSILWSIVLLLTCFSILFFIYSGFAITLKRRRNSSKISNKFSKDVAEYIILIGSETGSTLVFANILYKALIARGKQVFISDLNNYSSYKKAKHLVVFTATYGDGEPPENAKNFQKSLAIINPQSPLQYSVVGFGSLAYREFCKYAILVDATLQLHKSFIPDGLLHKINNQSFDAFEVWVKSWAESKKLNLKIKEPQKDITSKNLRPFKIIRCSKINSDQSFLLELEPTKKTKFTSGDILSVYPENNSIARKYSIGKIDKNIILSIRKHEFGLCSNYLSNLKENDMLLANIKQNSGFHIPTSAKEVVMIANGTGIAPFLGMISNKENKQLRTHLFWGGRRNDSFKMYVPIIDNAFYNKTLSSLHLIFSHKESKNKYVQNRIQEKDDLICRVLKEGGIIMICGSLAMQKGVFEILNGITISRLNEPINTYQDKNQIKTDCY
jgi:sulfite reductase (NADPH) flavoprotein alpha-component